MIRKPAVLITSIGRTGTKFFSALLGEMIRDAASFHEPDVLHFMEGEGYGTREVLKQIRQSGVANLVIRKLLGRWSLVALSDARLRGDMPRAEAAE